MLANNEFDKILKFINDHNLSILATKKRYIQKIGIRRITETLLGALIQYTGLQLSDFSLDAHFIWPMVGITLALFFLRGQRIFVGIWLGSLLHGIHSNGNAAIFPIILMQTLGAQVMHWIFTKMHSSIIPLSRLQSLYFFLGITCAFSILFGFLHNLSANIEFMFAYYLSFLLLTPVCLIWDHDTLKRKNFLSKHKIGLALNLMFLFCCGSLLFAYSTLYSLLLFIGILLCVIAGYVMCGQWGGVILGMQLSIFLIAIPEMPMYEIWENSIDISILQVSICLSVILGLSFSTFRKETYFKNYLRHHPVLL